MKERCISSGRGDPWLHVPPGNQTQTTLCKDMVVNWQWMKNKSKQNTHLSHVKFWGCAMLFLSCNKNYISQLVIYICIQSKPGGGCFYFYSKLAFVVGLGAKPKLELNHCSIMFCRVKWRLNQKVMKLKNNIKTKSTGQIMYCLISLKRISPTHKTKGTGHHLTFILLLL